MFKRRKKKLSISAPINFEHRIHAGYDINTGKFVGLPIQWTSIIENQNDERRKSISNIRELDNSIKNSKSQLIDPSNLNITQLNGLKQIVRGNKNHEFISNSLSSNSLNQSYTYDGSLNWINPINVLNSSNLVNYSINQNLNLKDSSTNSLTSVYHSTPIKHVPLQLNISNQVDQSYSLAKNSLIKPPTDSNLLINQFINLSLDNSFAETTMNQPVIPSSSSLSFDNISSPKTSLSNVSQSEQKTMRNQSQDMNVINKEYPEKYYRLSPFQRYLYDNFLPSQIKQQFFHLTYAQQQRLLQVALEKQQQLQTPQYQLQLKLKRERQLQYLHEREREKQLQMLIAQKQNFRIENS